LFPSIDSPLELDGLLASDLFAGIKKAVPFLCVDLVEEGRWDLDEEG
jgi:hypothetical protein